MPISTADETVITCLKNIHDRLDRHETYLGEMHAKLMEQDDLSRDVVDVIRNNVEDMQQDQKVHTLGQAVVATRQNIFATVAGEDTLTWKELYINTFAELGDSPEPFCSRWAALRHHLQIDVSDALLDRQAVAIIEEEHSATPDTLTKTHDTLLGLAKASAFPDAATMFLDLNERLTRECRDPSALI